MNGDTFSSGGPILLRKSYGHHHFVSRVSRSCVAVRIFRLRSCYLDSRIVILNADTMYTSVPSIIDDHCRLKMITTVSAEKGSEFRDDQSHSRGSHSQAKEMHVYIVS